MKKEVAHHLCQLVGLRLTKTTRAADMQCFQFGHLLKKNKSGRELEMGELALHFQCPWRLTADTQILVGSMDLFEPPDENAEYDENFNWDIAMGNLRDVRLQQIVAKNLVVHSFFADDFGGFTLSFQNNLKLWVFPSASRLSEFSEFWRLLDNRENESKHYVMNGAALKQKQNSN